MSLWKVPDDPTSVLMTEYYRCLLRGVPRVDALREAQHAVRAQFPSPHYWGAFITLGDWRPLPS
jgi:CHAT domain-containing protein